MSDPNFNRVQHGEQLTPRRNVTQVISETSNVKLSLVIAAFTIFAGGTWWLSSLNSAVANIAPALEKISTQLNEMCTESVNLRKEAVELRVRVNILEERERESRREERRRPSGTGVPAGTRNSDSTFGIRRMLQKTVLATVGAGAGSFAGRVAAVS